MSSPLLDRAYGRSSLSAHVSSSIGYLCDANWRKAAKLAAQATVIAAVIMAGEHYASNPPASRESSGKIVQEKTKQKLQEVVKNNPDAARILAKHLADKWKISVEDAKWLVQAAKKHGERTGKDGALFLAVALQESGGKHKDKGQVVKSKAGAVGVMQIMPELHKGKIDIAAIKTKKPTDSREANFHAGADILVEYIDRSKGNVDTGLKRYNGSLNHPFGETYVNGVLQKMSDLEKAIYSTYSHDRSAPKS